MQRSPRKWSFRWRRSQADGADQCDERNDHQQGEDLSAGRPPLYRFKTDAQAKVL
jgi:hypothetical protein